MIEDLKHKFENYKPYINGYKNMKRASVLIPIVKKITCIIYYFR